MKRRLIQSVTLAIVSLNALGQQSDFHWVSTDSTVSKQVHTAFANELAPDRDDPETHTLPMTFKFIHRVGLRGNSALVLIGEKESKASPYAVYRAFSFDLRTQAKAAVRSKARNGFGSGDWKRCPTSDLPLIPTSSSNFLPARSAKPQGCLRIFIIQEAREYGKYGNGAEKTAQG